MKRTFEEIPIEIYSSILIHNPDPIFLLDESGAVLDVNIAATKVFGYSKSEWADVTYKNIIAHENKDIIVELFSKSLKGEFCSCQISAYDKKGSLRHLHVKFVPLFKEALQFKKIMVVVEDQTELIEIRNALQKRLSN